MKQTHLSSTDLATRWNIKESTLEQWRWFGRGPSFLKIGGSIRYRIKDVERFEHLQMHCLADHVSHSSYSQLDLTKSAEATYQEERVQ